MMGAKFQPVIPLLLFSGGYRMLCCLNSFPLWRNVPHLFCFGIMLSPDMGLTSAAFLTVLQWCVIFLPFHVLSWFYLLSIAHFWETFDVDFKLSSEVFFCLQWIVDGCAICIYDSVDHVTSPKHFKFLKIVSWLTTAFSHVSMKSTLRSESFCLDFFFLLLRLKQPRYIWYLANNEKLCLISGCSVKHHYKTKVIQTCFSTSLMKWLLWLFSSWSHQGTGTIKVMMW